MIDDIKTKESTNFLKAGCLVTMYSKLFIICHSYDRRSIFNMPADREWLPE